MRRSKRIKLSKSVCPQCNLNMKGDPFQLPCGASICIEHTQNLNQYKLTCESCKQDHIISHANLKKNVESLFSKIEDQIDEFKLKFNEFEYFNHEYFAEIERQVEIRRENLKNEIDLISEQMIQLCKSKCKTFHELSKKNSIDDIKKQVQADKEEFSKVAIVEQKLEDFQDRHKKSLDVIQAKLGEFSDLKQHVEKYEFLANTNTNTNSIFTDFGYLSSYRLKHFLVYLYEDNLCEIWDILMDKRINKFFLRDIDGEELGFRVGDYLVINGTNLLTLGLDGMFRIFDLKTGSIINSFGKMNEENKYQPLVVNDTSVIVQELKMVNTYCLATGHLERSIKLKRVDDYDIFVLLDNGSFLCEFDEDTRIQLKHFINGATIQTFVGHADSIEHVKVTPDKKRFISIAGGQVKVWSIDYSTCLHTFSDFDLLTVFDMVFTNDGKLVTSSKDYRGNNGVVKIFDSLKSFECVRTIRNDNEEKMFAIKADEGGRLFGMAFNSMVKTWSVDTGECLKTFDKLHNNDNPLGDRFEFCLKF